MFDKIKRLLGKPVAPEQPDMPDVGAINGQIPHLPILGLSGFGLRNGSYDNTFPSISRIADAIAEVQPIAINAEGKEVKNAHLLEVLNRPNKEMCSTDFMEALAVMLLVHPKVHLLLWRKNANGELEAGGQITEQNIAGLTFMEGANERIIAGKSEFHINGRVFTENEVISLSLAVNPYRLSDGYSPSVAAKKWATTDDYIAEYHNAQFRNNARPAGMLTIVADTAEEFNDAVDTIEAKFRGASNAGNTIYNMRPSQTLDGKPAPAKIEWTPFAMTNKDLTLQPIYEQANRKMENVFGVPDEVRGHLQNSNYASAEVADYIFSRRVVYPTLVKIYAKLTHEFNRVFGGMGYALSFHYEVPMLTDTRKLQAEALKTMIDAGFSVETSVEALRLPESYRQLKLASTASTKQCSAAQAVEAELRSNEADDAVADRSEAKRSDTCAMRPNKSTSAQLHGIKVALEDEGEEDEGELPQAKADLVSPNLLIAYNNMTHQIMTEIEMSITDYVALYEDDELDVEHELDLLEGVIERNFRNAPELERDITEIKSDLDGLRAGTVVARGQDLAEQLGEEVDTLDIGLKIKDHIEQVVADDLYDSYRATAKNLLNATAVILYQVLGRDIDKTATPEELESEILGRLAQLGEKQEWRAVRFGFTEQQIVMSITAQMLWEWAQNEYKFKGYKTWRVSPLSPAPCEDCLKIDGETVRITEKFSNGLMYPPLHPNCYCFCVYSTSRTGKDVGRVERSVKQTASDEAGRPQSAERATGEDGKECQRTAKHEAVGQANAIGEASADAQPTIKITCPKCGRFLMDASSAKIQKMICPNTKCKARLSIDTVKEGATIVKELKAGEND